MLKYSNAKQYIIRFIIIIIIIVINIIIIIITKKNINITIIHNNA